MNQKGISSIVIILIIVGVLVIAGGIWAWQNLKEKPVVCSQDTKLCPDGSYVSRTGPNCEFATCPEVKDETADWQTYRNEKYEFEFKYPAEFTPKIYVYDKFVEGARCKIEIYFEPTDSEGKLQISSCIDSWGISGGTGLKPATLDNLPPLFLATDKNNWKKTTFGGLDAVELINDKSYRNTVIIELPSKVLVEIAVKDRNMYESIKKNFIVF